VKRGNALVRIYLHNERHERSYGEVKLWLVFAKPQTYGRKVEETEVKTVPLFNFPNNSWHTHQNSQAKVRPRIICMQVSYHMKSGLP